MADFSVTEYELREIIRIGFPDLRLVKWSIPEKEKYVTYDSIVCMNANNDVKPTPAIDELLGFLDQARQAIAANLALSLKVISFNERYSTQLQLINLMLVVTGGDKAPVQEMLDYWNSL